MSAGWLFLVLLAAAPGESSVGTNAVEIAKKYFEAGSQAYQAGDFLAAASAFEEAQNLSPRPAIIFSTAQAYRQQYFVDRDAAKLARAIELYGRYLAEEPRGARRSDAIQHLEDLKVEAELLGPRAGTGGGRPVETKTQLMVSSRTPGARASIDGSEPQEVPLIAEVEAGRHLVKVEAEGYLTTELSSTAVDGRLVVAEVNLDEMTAIVRVAAPDGADVMIDGRPLGQAPLLLPVELPAGDHFVAVTARGAHPFVRTMKLARGEEVTVVAVLESTTQRDVSYVFIGGGAALFAATGITVVGALLAEGQARLLQRKLDVDGVNLTVAERDRFNELHDRRADLITASTLMLAGAVVIGGAGTLMYFLDTPSVHSRGATPLEVDVAPRVEGAGPGSARSSAEPGGLSAQCSPSGRCAPPVVGFVPDGASASLSPLLGTELVGLMLHGTF